MSKDKILGAIIMVIGVVLIIGYTIIGPIDLFGELNPGSWVQSLQILDGIPGMNWKVAVVVPIWLIVVLVGIIMAWIGVSMITTPPPVPLEELEEELEAEEAQSA